jgi:hypothetical protein
VVVVEVDVLGGGDGAGVGVGVGTVAGGVLAGVVVVGAVLAGVVDVGAGTVLVGVVFVGALTVFFGRWTVRGFRRAAFARFDRWTCVRPCVRGWAKADDGPVAAITQLPSNSTSNLRTAVALLSIRLSLAAGPSRHARSLALRARLTTGVPFAERVSLRARLFGQPKDRPPLHRRRAAGATLDACTTGLRRTSRRADTDAEVI